MDQLDNPAEIGSDAKLVSDFSDMKKKVQGVSEDIVKMNNRHKEERDEINERKTLLQNRQKRLKNEMVKRNIPEPEDTAQVNFRNEGVEPPSSSSSSTNVGVGVGVGVGAGVGADHGSTLNITSTGSVSESQEIWKELELSYDEGDEPSPLTPDFLFKEDQK